MSLEAWDSKLSICDTVDGTYTQLAEITDISGIGITGEANEDSVLGQRWAAFSGGKLTADPFTLALNWNPGLATHATLLALAKSQAKKYWKLEIQGGTIVVQYGHVTGFKPGAFAVTGKVTCGVTVTPSGEPIVTPSGEPIVTVGGS